MLNAAAELKPGLGIKISQSSAGLPKQPCGDADLSKNWLSSINGPRSHP